MKVNSIMNAKLKFSRILPLTLAAFAIGAMPALAGPAVVRGDFDQDGQDDVFAIRHGVCFIRPNAADAGQPIHEATFLTPPAFLDPDTVKVADLDQDGFDDVLLASRQANRLLVIYGQAILTDPLRTDEFALPGGPAGADAAQYVGSGPLEIVGVLHALPQPAVALLDHAGALLTTYSLPPGAASWSSLDVAAARLLPGALPQFAWLTRDTDNDEHLWWAEFTTASPGSPPVMNTNRLLRLGALSLGPDPVEFPCPRLGHGRLLLGTEQGQWVVLPLRTNVLAIAPAAVAPNAAPVVHRESLSFVGQGGAVIPDPAGDILLVIAADGSFARLFRWQGPGNLSVVENIPAPPGQSLLHALPLSDGNVFMALRATGNLDGGWSSFAHYNRQGTPGYSFVESFPDATRSAAVARVMVFDRDPFGGDALEWESFSLNGWALSAQVQAGAVLVTYQPDPGVPGGLGEQTQTSLTPHRPLPSTAVALANQWEPDSSVFFGVAPALPGGAGVSPQPPPGSYGTAIDLTFLAAQNVAVNFRLGNGNWQTGRGPVEVAQSMSVEYYGVTEGGYAGPIVRTQYAIGEPGSPLPGALKEDRNQNGFDDSWERLFFGDIGVDPDGDEDNDFSTNREEYEGGTNPRDPLSRPTTPDSERRILASIAPDGSFRFRLASDTGVDLVPEYSENLTEWFPLPGSPATLPDGSREWIDPDPPAGNRYYRFSLP